MISDKTGYDWAEMYAYFKLDCALEIMTLNLLSYF